MRPAQTGLSVIGRPRFHPPPPRTRVPHLTEPAVSDEPNSRKEDDLEQRITEAVPVVRSFLETVLGLLGVYIADEYVTPAVSEQSVPPPRLY